MYGMTREEAADTALAYHRLVEDVRRIHAYLLSTMPLGTVLEIMRPVERVLLDSALSESGKPDTAKVPMVLVPLSELEELSIMAAVSTADPNVEELEEILDAIGNKVELLIPAPSPSGVEESK